MRDRVQVIKETLQFQDLTPEEKEKRGILGRLYGPCASITIPTRNGRTYNEKLWNYQFSNNEILKEMFENGGVPMELDHPQDREETQSDKIAAMMPELPKKDKDGHLITYVDLIDTPMGRIAYQLAKYGFKLGISSRGTGDLVTDEDGNESVDPETYDLTTFDLVLVPAVKDARLTMCESMEMNNGGEFKKALCECLDKASKEDRVSLTEAINNLGINISNDDNINTSKQLNENLEGANNDGSDEIIKSLQEALKDKTKLEEEVKSLQEKLAVSNAKVDEVNEELSNYKSTTTRLSTIAQGSKELSEKVSSLEEELDKKNKLIESLKSRNTKLVESRKEKDDTSKSLNETLAKKDTKIRELRESVSTYQKQVKELNEKLLQESEISNKKLDEMVKKVNKSNQLVESYKELANDIVEKYIETKATMLGVSKNEIKNKLSESYTLDDIDQVCEDLQSYALNISKLPFNFGNKVKVRVTESKKETLRGHTLKEKEMGEDDVDDSLIKMAGLEKK